MPFIFYLVIILIMFLILLPYIMCVILLAIIICIISTKLIKSKALKFLMIISIILFSFILLSNFKSETPDTLYTEMRERNNNQSLIGLPKEVVVELLGKPEYEYTDRENKTQYIYYAGKIFKESYWGYSYSSDYYELNISFDENDKVKSTYIQLST